MNLYTKNKHGRTEGNAYFNYTSSEENTIPTKHVNRFILLQTLKRTVMVGRHCGPSPSKI